MPSGAPSALPRTLPRAVQNHRHRCWCQAEDGSRRLMISPAVDCADGTLRVGVGWGGCVLFCFGIPSVCSYACEILTHSPHTLHKAKSQRQRKWRE